jgi:hypothetical protein
MKTIKCPKCGFSNSGEREVCDICDAILKPKLTENQAQSEPTQSEPTTLIRVVKTDLDKEYLEAKLTLVRKQTTFYGIINFFLILSILLGVLALVGLLHLGGLFN